MKLNDAIFEYSNGHSVCVITYKDLKFAGEAFCHDDDRDYESERTGLCIAEARANIKLLQFRRKFEIQPKLNILKHLFTNINSSKHHNEKNYEYNMIKNQLIALNNELDEITNAIKEEKKYLKEYIDNKDKFYKKLRTNNNKESQAKNN